MNEYVLALAQYVQSPCCLFSKARLWHLENGPKRQRTGGSQTMQEGRYHVSEQEMQRQPRQVFGTIFDAYTRHKWDTQQD